VLAAVGKPKRSGHALYRAAPILADLGGGIEETSYLLRFIGAGVVREGEVLSATAVVGVG
jgi:hypothetical protein